MSEVIIREAVKNDFIGIKSLLDSASLPSIDIEKHFPHFFVLINERKIIGSIGMEVYGDVALLRSLAVKKDFQHKSYGRKLCRTLISKAKKMEIVNIYLLTETAEGFFSKEGFQKIKRDYVPSAIKKTYEYSTLCPKGAVCMVKKLAN